ncbi:MAG TPA: cupredoxin domain-containing protein [Gaiellaceae bacterium]|jgi:plastocyanin
MKRVMLIALLLGAVVVVAAGCGSSSSSSGGGGGTTESSGSGGGGGGHHKKVAGVSANDHGTKQVSGEADVELDDYYFEPTVIEGKAGSTVKLELENEGSMTHSFTLASQNIDKVIEPGEDATVMVKIPKSGVVSFYCKFHKSEGMAGGLAVNGADVSSGSGGGTGTTGGMTTGSYDGY